MPRGSVTDPKHQTRELRMTFLKKEWKTVVIVLVLTFMTIFLFLMNAKLKALSRQNAKLISTIDSIESVVINSDASMIDMSKKVDTIDANIDFILKKVRRR